MQQRKLCKDCKYSTRALLDTAEMAECRHEKTVFVSLVTGAQIYPNVLCYAFRGADKPCGPEGKLWEARGA